MSSTVLDATSPVTAANPSVYTYLLVLNPLTTNAKSYSDMPEIFTTDSLNLKKNKSMNFFPPGVTKI